jgi:MFS family permease
MPLASLLAPLRHAMFRRFFIGQAISRFGDAVFYVALAWQVLLLTGSSTSLGGIYATYFAAQVAFLLVGGAIVDRYSRRTIVVTSDVLQGLFVGGIAVLTLTGGLREWHLYVLGGLFGAAQSFAMPAMNAFVPETVPPGDIQGANSLYHGASTLMFIAGPATGAAVILVGGTASAFFLDAASFGVSATLLATVRHARHPQMGGRGESSSVVGTIREGVRFVRRVPWIWITILLFAVVNAAEAGPRNVVLPAFVGIELGAGAGGIGAVASAMGVGALVGIFLPNILPRIRDRGLAAYLTTAAIGAVTVLYGFAGSLLVLVGLGFALGICHMVFGLIWQTSINEYVDEGMQGRVFSIDMFGSFILLPVSMALSGIFAEAVGARIVFIAGGLIVIGCAALGLVHPPARRFVRGHT